MEPKNLCTNIDSNCLNCNKPTLAYSLVQSLSYATTKYADITPFRFCNICFDMLNRAELYLKLAQWKCYTPEYLGRWKFPEFEASTPTDAAKQPAPEPHTPHEICGSLFCMQPRCLKNMLNTEIAARTKAQVEIDSLKTRFDKECIASKDFMLQKHELMRQNEALQAKLASSNDQLHSLLRCLDLGVTISPNGDYHKDIEKFFKNK